MSQTLRSRLLVSLLTLAALAVPSLARAGELCDAASFEAGSAPCKGLWLFCQAINGDSLGEHVCAELSAECEDLVPDGSQPTLDDVATLCADAEGICEDNVEKCPLSPVEAAAECACVLGSPPPIPLQTVCALALADDSDPCQDLDDVCRISGALLPVCYQAAGQCMYMCDQFGFDAAVAEAACDLLVDTCAGDLDCSAKLDLGVLDSDCACVMAANL